MRITRSGTTAVARRYQDLLGNTFQGHDALQNSPLGASSGHSIHGATGRVLSDGNASGVQDRLHAESAIGPHPCENDPHRRGAEGFGYGKHKNIDRWNVKHVWRVSRKAKGSVTGG